MQTRDGSSSYSPPPSIDLGTVDLAGPQPNGPRAKIESVCVHAVLATPAGTHVDPEKLAHFIDSRFDHLFDGANFDFGPVLRGLLKIEGVREEELYVGLVNLIGVLAGMGVVMVEPRMSLDAQTKQRLLDEARAATETARATFERRSFRARLAEIEREKLGTLMVMQELITPEQLDAALAAQARHGGRIGTNLVQMGMVTPEELARFLGEQLDLPCVTSIGPIAREVLDVVPANLAAQFKVLPLEMDDDYISLAMADPADLEVIERIERATGRAVRPTVAPELVLTYAMARHYDVRQPARMRIAASPMLRLMTDTPSDVYGLGDLASDFARADDHFDVLAMAQRYFGEHYAIAAVFDVADGVVRGFAASGIEGDPKRVREHFVRYGAERPDDAWFAAALGLSESEALEIATVYADEDPAAMFVVARAREGLEIDPATLRKVRVLTSTAIRMVDFRADILAAAAAH